MVQKVSGPLAIIACVALSFCFCSSRGQVGYRMIAPPSTSLSVLVNQPGITLAQVLDTMHAHIDLSDSGEDGEFKNYTLYKQFWEQSVFANDSSGHNMFQHYYRTVLNAAASRLLTSCSGGNYGSWECIGPNNTTIQAAGYVNTVWADPLDSNYILAGTPGGLFKTVNGGTDWECITDNTVMLSEVVGVSSIAVNPLRRNTIYIGTSGIPDYPTGSGILKSFDGGSTWQIELIRTGSFTDSLVGDRKTFF